MVTWSRVWVAIRLKRISVSVGATAGDTTGLTKMPSLSRSRVMANVLLLSRMKSGMIGVLVLPISHPISRKPSRA